MVKKELDRITWDDLRIEELATWGTKPLEALVESLEVDGNIADERIYYLVMAIRDHVQDLQECIYRLNAEQQRCGESESESEVTP